ncbi:MAG: S8/S53 family peptidase [Anaerolineae bacterium]|nr:S8/S53 family peptidase [Anaerolineae bacterium]
MKKNIIVVIIAIIVAFLYWLFGRKKPELHYFLPGEIVLQIRHPVAALPEDAEKIKTNLVEAMKSFLGSAGNSSQEASVNAPSAVDRNWRKRLDLPTRESIITFPSFSLVPVQLSGYDVKNDMDTRIVRSILRQALAELKQNDVLDLGNGLSIQSISPNWLVANLHHGGATGGPGGRPYPALEPQPNEQGFRIISSAANLINTINIPRQTNTSVAILDTAPTATAISDARHNKWPDHPVLQRLFGAKGTTGRLTIHHASPATLYDVEHFSPALHEYLMPDHGTFIAGIINNGAPGATLHLYEVLSRYGVGTFTSIAQGIADAISDLGRPLIINCSFMFCLPDGTYLNNLINDLNVTLNGLTQTMRQVFESILDPNITIVASAGNESTSLSRVEARYPAAFSNVMGVGALPKGNLRINNRYIPASYSNLADDPPENGFMTFGGEDGPGQGIRGLYISGFPNPLSINQTGWAWWAGTSFATAIITGFLAAELSSNSGFLAPNANETNPQAPFLTAQGEPVILVNQG